MKILLDTCIFKALLEPKIDPILGASLQSAEDENLFLSTITLLELVKWVSLQPAGREKTRLQSWLSQLEQKFKDKIIPITSEIAAICGELTAKAEKFGKILPLVPALTAATALAQGLHIFTKNSFDFYTTGALLINPWENA